MEEMKKPLICDTIPLWTVTVSTDAGVFMFRPEDARMDNLAGNFSGAFIRPPVEGNLVYCKVIMKKSYTTYRIMSILIVFIILISIFILII